MNRKRAQSPKSSIPQRRSPQRSTNRSKSVPNEPSTKNTAKQSKQSPRSPVRNSVDEIFDPLSSALESKQVFQARHRKTLLEALKRVKQVGSRFANSYTKPPQLAIEFWKQWKALQTQIKQGLEDQLSRSPAGIEKNLLQVDSAMILLRDKRKASEAIATVKDLVEQTREILTNPPEVRTLVAFLNQWKQTQTEFASNHVFGSNAYGFTSAMSQIVAQLSALKEVISLKTSIDSIFDNTCEHLREVIPEPAVQSPTKERKKQTYQITQKETRLPTPRGESPKKTAIPVARRTPSPRKQSEEQTPVRTPKEDVRRRPPRKSEDIEDTESEIETLKKELEQLTEQSNKLTRKLEQHQTQSIEEDPIVPLRMQKRELEEEMIHLDASIQRLMAQIDDPKVIEVYKENADLRRQRRDMNKDLLTLREKCLRMNSVSQKASLFSKTVTGEASALFAEYKKALAENEKVVARRNTLASDMEALERKRDSLLFEKYFSDGPVEETMEGLVSLSSSYKQKKDEYLAKQQKAQNDAVLILRRKTERAIVNAHRKAVEELKEPMARKAELTEQYNELKDAYNDTVLKGKDIVYDEGDGVVTVEDAKETLEDLSQEYRTVSKRIKQIQQKEIDEEKEIIQNEMEELEKGNQELVRWISQVQQNLVETQAELQCFAIEHQILEKAVSDPGFDAQGAFDEALEKTHQGNEKLKMMLQLVMDELTGLDVDLGGTSEEMSLEERIVSISEKVKGTAEQ